MKHLEIPQSRCLAGVTRGEITPPVGIYHRMWGAATHDRSTGIHRPLTATVLCLEQEGGAQADDQRRVAIGVDHCLLGFVEMEELLDRVARIAQVPRDGLLVFFSHTHGAGLMGYERRELPGGDLIPAYLQDLADRLGQLILTARAQCQPATIVYGLGRCGLAANRDYRDEDRGQSVCGFNPLGVADDAVLVGRICGAGGRVLGTLVNYACHPTTLAWQNTRISPDYVGAMRQVVEEATSAPCLFVQGASGDLGPRDGFVGEAEVADRNGRCLGYAVLSTLESLPAPGRSYAYAGPVVSGATLGVWEYVELAPPRARQLGVWRAERFVVPLKYRGDLPQADLLLRDREHWRQAEARAQQAGDAVAARDARAMAERATRALSRVGHLPPGDWFPYPVQLWRMGDAVWLALGGEHYNLLQRELRRRFPGVPLLIGTLANGSNVWYVLDQDSYGRGLYQESVSVLAKGSLERLIETLASQVEALFS